MISTFFKFALGVFIIGVMSLAFGEIINNVADDAATQLATTSPDHVNTVRGLQLLGWGMTVIGLMIMGISFLIHLQEQKKGVVGY